MVGIVLRRKIMVGRKPMKGSENCVKHSPLNKSKVLQSTRFSEERLHLQP